MSIASVRLPDNSDSSYDSSSDILPPPVNKKPTIPTKTEMSGNIEDTDNLFEVGDEENTPIMVDGSLNYESLGLPPLSLTSDPFLSPINSVQFAVKRHRIWVKGIKGVKFTLSISGYTVLVAKRKMKYLKKAWFISRSSNFSLDTPDLVGILVNQRRGKSFSLFGPNERQSDHCRPALIAVDLNEPRRAIIGKDIWLAPETDDIFDIAITEENAIKMNPVPHQYDVRSVKNGAFCIESEGEPCFIAAKQVDKSVVVTAKAPLSLAQAFGLTISLFMQ